MRPAIKCIVGCGREYIPVAVAWIWNGLMIYESICPWCMAHFYRYLVSLSIMRSHAQYLRSCRSIG